MEPRTCTKIGLLHNADRTNKDQRVQMKYPVTPLFDNTYLREEVIALAAATAEGTNWTMLVFKKLILELKYSLCSQLV